MNNENQPQRLRQDVLLGPEFKAILNLSNTRQ